jgi:hypothetical protein
MKVLEAYTRRFIGWWKGLSMSLPVKIGLSLVILLFACGACAVALTALTPDSPEPEPAAAVAEATALVESEPQERNGDVTEPTAAPPTPTDKPTATATNKPTATATDEPTATATAKPTATARPTNTPRPTATPAGPVTTVNEEASAYTEPSTGSVAAVSLSPGDEIAILEMNPVEGGSWYRVQSLNTGRIGWIWGEAIAGLDSITDIPVSTATPTPTNTPDPRGSYAEIDIRELESYADDHVGEKVKIQGEIFNVLADGLQIWVNKPGGSQFDRVAVIVSWFDENILPAELYEGDFITIYGIGAGTIDGTNAFGGTITQPLIFADIIEK